MNILATVTLLAALGHQRPTVSIDFSRPRRQASMSGFLLSQINVAAGGKNTIPLRLIAPLRPHYWRGNIAFRAPAITQATLHVLFPAMTFIDVLSDAYGYPPNGKWSSAHGVSPPFDLAPYAGGAAAWQRVVRGVVRAASDRRDVVFEEWNEPDGMDAGNAFFYGTANDAYAVMSAAYAAMHQADAGAIAAGPAQARYDVNPRFLNDYLTYCVEHHCELPYLTYHDNSEDTDIPLVAAQLRRIRALATSPAYARLGIGKIVVDEYGGPQSNRAPGDLAAYLYYLEAGGADGAVKACWSSPSQRSECYDGSLDGIIDPASNQVRAAWWIYKFYADGVGSRVACTTVDPGIVALASSGSATPGVAQVLLAAIAVNGRQPSTSSPVLLLQNIGLLPGFAHRSAARVAITPIPATGTTPMPALTPGTAASVPIVDGNAQVAVHVAVHTAALVTISP